jgi:hypothetical protein
MEFVLKLSSTAFFSDYWHMDWEAAHTNKGVKSARHFLKKTLSKARRLDSKKYIRDELRGYEAG